MTATIDKSARTFLVKIPLPRCPFGALATPPGGGMAMGGKDIVSVAMSGERLDEIVVIFIIASLVFGFRVGYLSRHIQGVRLL